MSQYDGQSLRLRKKDTLQWMPTSGDVPGTVHHIWGIHRNGRSAEPASVVSVRPEQGQVRFSVEQGLRRGPSSAKLAGSAKGCFLHILSTALHTEEEKKYFIGIHGV